jgi:predicted PurR-regulated permease PerM
MSSEKREIVDISNLSLVRLLSSVIIFIVSLYFVYKVKNVLILLAISAFLAVSIYRPVNFIARKLRVSRAIGTLIAYAIVVSILSYLAWATLPSLVKQVYNLVINAPEMVENAKNSSQMAASVINGLNLEQRSTDLSSYVSTHWQDVVSGVAGQFQSFIGFFASMFTVLIVTFLIISEGPEMMERFWSLFKDGKKKKDYQKLVNRMYMVVTGYTNGQVILTTLNATFALIFILIASKIFGVNVQYPLALWAMIWLAGLIPMVGATLGAIIAVLFTVFYSWKLSLAIVIYYIIYQQIENSTLQPWIQSKSIHASALTIFVSALIGGSFGGIVGAFVAIPVAGCIKVGLDFYFKEHAPDKLKPSKTKS